MLVSKLIPLLLATAFVYTQALPSWQHGHVWQSKSWGNVSVTAIDSHFYVVAKNESHVSIKSDDSAYQDCDLLFNDTHIGRIQVVSIERKILMLFRQNSTIVRMLQLDPALCLYTPLPSLETQSTLEPKLIVMNNTLDVFLKGGEDCFPCRFDVNGKRLEVTGQLAKCSSSFFNSFSLAEFIRQGRVRNYVLAGNFENGTSVLKVLDQNFNTTKQIYFRYHQVEALSANSDFNKTWIGITYAGLGSPYERVLALYTDTLDLWYETRLRKREPGYKVLATLLSINSDGQSCVNSMQMQPSSSPSSPTYRYMTYAIYNSEGQDLASGHYDNLPTGTLHDWQLFRCNEKIFCYAFHSYDDELDSLHPTTSNIVRSDA